MKTDIYKDITGKIVDMLEQGVKPWETPWQGGNGALPLRSNGKAYSGINRLVLWLESMHHGYESNIWLTFKQAKELSAYVRKGAHGCKVVYASTYNKVEQDNNGNEAERTIPFLKAYTVFNVDQIQGLPTHFYPVSKRSVLLDETQRLVNPETFVHNTGAMIVHEGNQACYIPKLDVIHMPKFGDFYHPEGYYSVLLHELTHWTKHETRLNRDLGKKSWGDAGYAMEELVAELGAAFLCGDLSVSLEPRTDHASYIDAWLKVLKGDSRAIFTASSHAQKACDYLHRLQSIGIAQAA